MLNYIPAFFAEKPEEARETYSLIAVTPRLRPGAAERTLRYLANPFADNYAAAVSAIFLDEMSSLWVQLFMLSDLIKVAIRAALLDELGDGEVLSEKDRAARCEYDKTVEAFERTLTIAGNILRGEQPAALSIPNNHKGALGRLPC